jgi:hypothetical protein
MDRIGVSLTALKRRLSAQTKALRSSIFRVCFSRAASAFPTRLLAAAALRSPIVIGVIPGRRCVNGPTSE